MEKNPTEELKDLKDKKNENDNIKEQNIKNMKESSFIKFILYQFLFSLKLFILKYTFTRKVSIINFIVWKSIFGFIVSIISIILGKKGFNKPKFNKNFKYLIIRICGPFFSLLFLILMIKNLKLLSIGLILNNSLFNTIVTKNKIFMVINLISLLLSGFSNNIFNYIYIFAHIVISKIDFSIENQNLFSNLISFIIGIILSVFNQKFKFDITTICFALINVSLSFVIEKNISNIKGNKYLLLLNVIGLINPYLLGMIIFKENIGMLDIISIILFKVYEFSKLISSKIEKEKIQ